MSIHSGRPASDSLSASTDLSTVELFGSKSVQPKVKRGRLLQRLSEGARGFQAQNLTLSDDEEEDVDAPALGRSGSDQQGRLRLAGSTEADDEASLRQTTSDAAATADRLGKSASDGGGSSTSEAALPDAASVGDPQAGKDRSQFSSSAPLASSAPTDTCEAMWRDNNADDLSEASFFEFLHTELNPEPLYPTPDAIWGQTERQRVYNAIAHVPYQLERLVWFGTLLCCDSFLVGRFFAYLLHTRQCSIDALIAEMTIWLQAVFTVLPIRFCRALASLASVRRQAGTGRGQGLQGQQLTDVLCVVMFGVTFLFLRSLDAGAIYFWMKDLTQEFLKLQVIYTAVEMFDKITCSFTVDSLEALSGTCTIFTSSPNKREHLGHLASDFCVTLALVMLHGLVLMCQGMAFSVAMNSKRNHALVALIIATNFVEIKGTIFKRFDTAKLLVMTCQDVVERFHLCLSLLFVVAEEMDSSGRRSPHPALLWRCAQIFVAEICIDVIKHAVLGKFNEIRPGVYREFTRDVCEKIRSSHSHNMHKIVTFEPFAAAALLLRILFSVVASKEGKPSGAIVTSRAGLWCLGWALLCGFKLLLGFWLKGAASAYVRHFERRQRKAGTRPPAPRMPTASNIAKLSKRD